MVSLMQYLRGRFYIASRADDSSTYIGWIASTAVESDVGFTCADDLGLDEIILQWFEMRLLLSSLRWLIDTTADRVLFFGLVTQRGGRLLECRWISFLLFLRLFLLGHLFQLEHLSSLSFRTIFALFIHTLNVWWKTDFVSMRGLSCAHAWTQSMQLNRVINFEVHFLCICQVVVMVLLHLLLYHLKLLKFIEVCQLLLISLDSFIKAVDLHLLFAMDVDVSLRVIEILCIDVLARVLLLSDCWGTLIRGGLLFLFGL